MPLDPDFVADCPYGPGGLLLDDIISVDKERGHIVASMLTHDELPLTREQRAHPVRHPRHVSGGLIVHMTGMLGFVHAYYVLGLRHAEGWIGYGGRIHSARFKNLARPGEPLILAGWHTQLRQGKKQVLGRYEFEFKQGDKVIYEGDQTALWMKIES